ncbi:MAG: hypothetical protein V1873_07125 [Verrucomicrobiota bacterium]
MGQAERVAFVCPRFSEKGTVGGAETLLKNLAEHAPGAVRGFTFNAEPERDLARRMLRWRTKG